MSTTIQQRMTARREDGFVVFLIGMRLNRWWKVWRWWPVAMAMPRMLRELGANPALGFLGGEQWGGRTTILVSYWKSAEDLMRFASSKSATHLPAWKAFYQSVGTNGDIGIWHETYVIAPETKYENIYVNMPAFGLGAVGELIEAKGAHARAPKRLGLDGEDQPITNVAK